MGEGCLSLIRGFCVKCGKNDVETFKGLCESCYVEENPLVQVMIHDSLTVNYCPVCFQTSTQEKWYKLVSDPFENVVEGIKKALRPLLKVPNDSNVAISLDVLPEELFLRKSLDVFATVSVFGSPLPGITPFEERVNVEICLLPRLCKSCIAVKGGQVRSIIQVRAHDRKPTQREVEEIFSLINTALKQLSGFDTSTFPVKIEKKRTGIDFYINNKEVANLVSRKVSETMLAKITQTFKDKGVDERGRKKSTSTVCIRFPSFKEGDLVQLKSGELLQFLAFEREKATFSDLKNRNIKKISAKNLWKNDPKLFLKIENVPEFMVISIGTKIVQLMSLKTYELAEISKEHVPKAIKEGETIPCFQDPQTGELRLLLKQENP